MPTRKTRKNDPKQATRGDIQRSTAEIKKAMVSKKPPKAVVKKTVPKTTMAAGMRAVEIFCTMKRLSLAKVVFAMCQEAIAKSWIEASARTGDEMVTARELYFGLYDDLLNAARPAPSHFLSSSNVPLRYRELFEGIKNKTVSIKGGAPMSYRWTNIPTEDLVNMTHVLDYHNNPDLNTLNSYNGNHDANGFHVIDNTPAIPTHNRMKEAVQHYFGCVIAAGEQKWLGGKTEMLKSVSVFAFAKGQSDSMDWKDMGTTMSHELPINVPYLAGLQLVENTPDSLEGRTEKFYQRFYVGPGQVYGHQILRKYTGYYGKRDVIQLQPIDLSAFVTDMRSLMNGTMNQSERSTASAIIDSTVSGAGGVKYPFDEGDDTGIEEYINIMWGQQMLSLSPVAVNAIPILAGTKRVRWGTQQFRMSPRKLGRMFCFKKSIENLRMLHPSNVDVDVAKENMFYYAVGFWPALDSQLNQNSYEHAEMNWSSNSFGGLQPQDIQNLHAHNFSESASDFKDYVVKLNEQFHGAKDFHPILDMSPHSETQIGGQLNLLTSVNPVVEAFVSGERIVVSLEEGIKRKLLTRCTDADLERYCAILKRRDLEVEKENLFSSRWSKDKKEKMALRGKRGSAPQITLGISSVLPRSGRFDVFKQMVIPQRNVNVNTRTNPFSKMAVEVGIRDTVRSDTDTVAPLIESMLSAYTHTHTRGSTFGVKTELMQVLEKRNAMGLGAGQAADMGGGLISQVLGGGEMGAFGDAIMGLNPISSVINDAGGWVMTGVNGFLGSTPQTRQQERRARRNK